MFFSSLGYKTREERGLDVIKYFVVTCWVQMGSHGHDFLYTSLFLLRLCTPCRPDTPTPAISSVIRLLGCSVYCQVQKVQFGLQCITRGIQNISVGACILISTFSGSLPVLASAVPCQPVCQSWPRPQPQPSTQSPSSLLLSV